MKEFTTLQPGLEEAPVPAVQPEFSNEYWLDQFEMTDGIIEDGVIEVGDLGPDKRKSLNAMIERAQDKYGGDKVFIGPYLMRDPNNTSNHLFPGVGVWVEKPAYTEYQLAHPSVNSPSEIIRKLY